MAKTEEEIVKQGYQALVEALGFDGAKRFIEHLIEDWIGFTRPAGQGDYTQERHQSVNQTSLQDILTLMKEHREDDRDRYDEIIK